MSTFKSIRERLEVTQDAMAKALGCSQGNVAFYDKGQTIPPAAATKLIAFAKTRGIELSYDDVYAQPKKRNARRPTEQQGA
jgi:putative transcriptional regulator